MKSEKKTILILSFSDLSIDPRVRRQIKILSHEGHTIITAGYQSPNLPGIRFIPIYPEKKNLIQKFVSGCLLLSGAFEIYYWRSKTHKRALQSLCGLDPDIVIANDIDALPLALAIAPSKKIVFDAHEYAPLEMADNFKWRLFYQRYKTYLCEKYIAQASNMMTVSEKIAEEYQRYYFKKPEVVTNAPPYVNLQPSTPDSKKIKLVCHSGAMPNRQLELLIGMFAHLDERFVLDFFLTPLDPKYLSNLKVQAKKYPQIVFHDPIPFKEIIPRLNGYDMGVYILPPSNFNNRYALPNKFFEFIQARLAIGIGPSPEMAHLVRKYDCGVVADTFCKKDLAGKLMNLTRSDLIRLKNNSALAAKDLCCEKNHDLVLKLIENK